MIIRSHYQLLCLLLRVDLYRVVTPIGTSNQKHLPILVSAKRLYTLYVIFTVDITFVISKPSLWLCSLGTGWSDSEARVTEAELMNICTTGKALHSMSFYFFAARWEPYVPAALAHLCVPAIYPANDLGDNYCCPFTLAFLLTCSSLYRRIYKGLSYSRAFSYLFIVHPLW